MRYLLISSVFCLFAFSGLTQDKEEHDPTEETEDHHCLFKKNSLSFGPAATYSFPLNAMGINSRLYYNIGERICFGPEFTYLKKGDETIYDFNFIGHFIFETKIVGIYPLIGANYTIEKKHNESEEAVGLVFGGGFYRNFDWITVFAEYSHVESHLRDDFATIGIMINLK
jgi:hypothetical protein